MKDFLKFTLASCLGVLIAFFGFAVIMSIAIGGISSSLSMNKASAPVKNAYLEIDLVNGVPELTNNATTTAFSFEVDDILGLHDIIRLISLAEKDENIKGIKIRQGQVNLGMASSLLLIDAIENFKKSGKPVVAYGDYYTQSTYKLASAADHIILSPAGGIDFRGFGVVSPFFKNTLDKIGIDMQVYFAGDYKSATEPFRLTSMSDENREQMREFINEAYDQYLDEISDNRGISKSELKRVADEFSIRTAQHALALGFVDQLGYDTDSEIYLKEKSGMAESDELESLKLAKYKSIKGNLIRGTEKNRIAVLYAEGDIVMGEGDIGTINEKRYTKAIQDILEDDNIKAVVLRVNSPGGSGLVSENILYQINKIKEKGLPLIVSMGDVAASGGYYISCQADAIYVQENTVTGSIGVYGMIPNIRGLLEDKMGITFDTVSTASYSTRLNSIYNLNDDEDAIIQQQVDFFYNSFLQKVAQGRGMTVEEVHKVAQGRIWTGNVAVNNGLADSLGTIDDAIAAASRMTELESFKLKEFPRVKPPLEQLLSEWLGEDYLGAQMESTLKFVKDDYIASWIRAALTKEPQARMWYNLDY